MRRCMAVVLLALCIPLLLDPPEGNACGPFLPEAQFGFAHDPGPAFLRGQLGIVRPEYFRRHLIVAYRYLAHAPLTAAEIQALSPKPLSGPLPVARWLAQRNAVAGSPPLLSISAYRSVFAGGYYAAYQNCLNNAFDTASATLAARTERWGAKSPQTAEWIRGQDQVFANCDGGASLPNNPPHIPPALPPDADPLLAADRQYQIAAANFYPGRFAEAARGFRELGENKSSPWREWGPYLAARALLREGTVGESQTALAAAEQALQAIIDDPKQERWRQSAHGLMEFVRARLHAEDQMLELGAALSKPGLGAGMEQAIIDYTAIWDRQQRGPLAHSDLADWITAFQARDAQHAVERWRAGGGTPWLVAALAAAQKDGPATPELIAEARQLRPADPAYATAAYHAIQLLIARHQEDEARRWADAALAAQLPLDAQNAIRAERLSLARDWKEFLRYAPRSPVAVQAVVADEPAAGYAEVAAQTPLFDRDAADALNRKMPLELWIDASRNPLLPARLQAQIAQAGWARAALLDRTGQAGALARRVAEVQPALAAGMRSYAAEKPASAARFDAVFLILRTPGLEPVVRAGFGRSAQLGQLDNFRDNWWKLAAASEPDSAPPAFLSGAQRTQGAKDWDELLAAAATGPTCLCQGAVTWARAHPNDPRVPEALHLAVRATRYGPDDPDTSPCSHNAFQLLHARYPKSEWAKKTKYWF